MSGVTLSHHSSFHLLQRFVLTQIPEIFLKMSRITPFKNISVLLKNSISCKFERGFASLIQTDVLLDSIVWVELDR